MSDLITPDDLPNWVPGETTVDSVRLGWEGVRTRGYRYGPSDVPVPSIREYLIVAYKNGTTTMSRRSTGTVRILQNDDGRPQWHAKWTKADGHRTPWTPLPPTIDVTPVGVSP